MRNIGSLSEIYEIFLDEENFAVDCEKGVIHVHVYVGIVKNKPIRKSIPLQLAKELPLVNSSGMIEEITTLRQRV